MLFDGVAGVASRAATPPPAPTWRRCGATLLLHAIGGRSLDAEWEVLLRAHHDLRGFRPRRNSAKYPDADLELWKVVGRVRRHRDGRRIVHLDFYAGLALGRTARIALIQRFQRLTINRKAVQANVRHVPAPRPIPPSARAA